MSAPLSPTTPTSSTAAGDGGVQPPPTEDTLKLVEAVLDYIRANLANIRNVWGVDSVQYRSASEIMNSYLDENLRAHRISKGDISDLLQRMSLDTPSQYPQTPYLNKAK